MQRYDAVVVGGGIAGSICAAALAHHGLDVLLCEAGLPSDKRLAGELMHPPALAVLERLGLADALREAGGAPVYGFSVFHDARVRGQLAYTEIGARPSLALEHGTMTRALLQAVRGRPGVTFRAARALAATAIDDDRVEVTLRDASGERTRVEAALVVSAEGRASRLRDRAGIDVTRGAPFRMVGWRVPHGRLPFPGRGHVFTGGASAVLAYQVAPDTVRVMFELGLDEDLDVSHLLPTIPQPLRGDVERAIATQPRQTAKVWGMCPHRASVGRIAVVGDAGGCVHPLTATGIAFCAQDAERLALEVGPTFCGGAGVPAALARYDATRRGPMRTRSQLGPALVEALTGTSPAMRLLRHGLFRYWRVSPAGRRRSLALLSTQEARGPVMALEYATVCAHALTGISGGVVSSREILPALAGLARRTVEQLRAARVAPPYRRHARPASAQRPPSLRSSSAWRRPCQR